MDMELIKKLDSPDVNERLDAVKKLSENFSPEAKSDNVNMHVHTFYSFNANNWSPSRIAYEYAKRGIKYLGIIDFDVIDGKEEFFIAGDYLKIHTSVGIETRAFSNAMHDKEIDSPGEPGVSYIAAAGFAVDLDQYPEEKKKLDFFRDNARERNIALIKRINAHVPDIAVELDKDVIPLTPSGNATERHIIKAYIIESERKFTGEKLVSFWMDILEKSKEEIVALIDDKPRMEDAVRSKFAKKGGYGYVQPSASTFPPVEDFFSWAKRCQAIPMESWLDGTSQGEKDPVALLERSGSMGAEALNIIPDRNWNIKDPDTRTKKVKNLHEIISAANRMDVPLNIGTEMNKKGQVFVDDLQGEVLKNFRNDFTRGAAIFTGHTMLTRFAGFSYTSEKANELFKSKKDKNDFFAAAGSLPAVDHSLSQKFLNAGPEKAFELITDLMIVRP